MPSKSAMSYPNQHETKLIRVKDVVDVTGLSRSYVYALADEGLFPKSVPLVPGGVARAWVYAEVQEWLEQRVAERDMGVQK